MSTHCSTDRGGFTNGICRFNSIINNIEYRLQPAAQLYTIFRTQRCNITKQTQNFIIYIHILVWF